MHHGQRTKNLLPFSESELQTFSYAPMYPPQRMASGRRVFRFQADELGFWLKGQTQAGLPYAQQGLQHELACYQLLQSASAAFLLPFQICKALCIAQEDDPAEALTQAVILPEGQAFFHQDPHSLSFERLKHCLWRAVDTLDQLYALGWLHGDLKASHFVEFDGQLKLIDFEQAQALGTAVKTMNATPRYMAPELFQGQPKDVQSEVYALGIIFYEWLSGQRLQAADYMQWAYLHCQHLKIQLPDEFSAFTPLLQGMLAKHKSQRMRDFSQVKVSLITEIA